MRTIIAGILLWIATAVSAADFYVAPTGNDADPGSREKPFATLSRARDAIRALKAQGPLTEPVHVNVADGAYSLTGPLVLGPADSGTAGAPVVYRAAPGAHPVLSGGRVITGWKQAENGLWKTRVPEAAAGRWYFEQLFVNGQRATRAREPNQFYFYLQDVREVPLVAGAKGKPARARQTVRMRQEDFDRTLARLRPEELRDVNFVVYHNWDNTRRFLEGVDAAQAALTTVGQGMKPWNPWRRNSHYHLENFLGALDAPGEWFLSRDGTLYYKPLPGESMDKADVVAPVVDKFLILAGDPGAGKFVEHVTFQGLAFRHAQWLTPPGGFEATQAAAPIEAVVMADGARHVAIEDCEIGHVGIYVVWFRNGCSRLLAATLLPARLRRGRRSDRRGKNLEEGGPSKPVISRSTTTSSAAVAGSSPAPWACGWGTAATTPLRIMKSPISTTRAFRPAGAGATARTWPNATRSR